MFKRLLVVFVVILSFSGVSYAGHPLITDDTSTQGKGKWQLEIGAEYYSHKTDEIVDNSRFDSKSTGFSLTPTLTYGIVDSVDLTASLPYQWQKLTVKENGADHAELKENGITNMTLALKWRFFEKDGLSLALKPGLVIPTGDKNKGLGVGKLGANIYFIATKEFDPAALHLNIGYKRNENSIDERKDLWHISLAGELKLIDKLKLVANIGAEQNRVKGDSTNPAFVLGGIIYSISKDIDIDLGVKAGLNKAEVDYSILAGLTVRF